MAAKAFTVGGVGYTPTVDDVVKVANGLQLVIDAAAADRLKKASPAPKAFQAEDSSPAPLPDGSPLTSKQTRAAIFAKLLSIAHGSSGVRLQVAEYLIKLLNANALPALPALDDDASVLARLADSCHGSGPAAADGAEDVGALAARLQQLTISPPAISAAERAVLVGGASAAAGVAALAVQSGKKLVPVATAVAALSCEATGAQVKAFDVDTVEASGQKGAMAAADELRGMLEGSKQVNAKKATVADPAAFALAPQVLGAATEALAAAYASTRSEVQSAALPAKGTKSQNTPPPLLPPSLLAAARAVLAAGAQSLARASSCLAAADLEVQKAEVAAKLEAAQKRASAVGQKLYSDLDATPTVAAALALDAAVVATSQVVALEAAAAVASLRQQEGPPAAAAPAAAAAAAQAAPATAADGDKKKDKKKDKKGPAGMVLGKGTALLRTLLEEATASSAGGSLQAVASLLDPSGVAASKLLDELRTVVEANQARRLPKVPKGTRDYLPADMAIREKAFNAITAVFKRHGAVNIDTPVFEVRETLMGKYGEDSKLIYDLADQGGEILSLRYDLTVPFARFVATNKIGNIKRYHIGKVYRRDQPAMNRGRFREFFQCDFDICGAYATMVADSEVLKVVVEILTDLQVGDFEIKINHRKLLDSMLAIAGVPAQKFRPVCSAIDKLDKEPWEAVRGELVDEKGLPGPVADKIGEFVVLRGEPLEMVAKLLAEGSELGAHLEARTALQELGVLFGFLRDMGALQPFVLDLSLARGLDYYTGVIYEAVLVGGNVGSIAGGGRYDKLVGMFSGKDIPAVGVSIGIERVFRILKDKADAEAEASGKKVRETDTEVLVASIGNGMQPQRMQLASTLWAAGIKAEFGFKPNPKMGDQLGYAFDSGIPFMVIFGEDELKAGSVKVKDIEAKTEDTVSTADLVAELKKRLGHL